jgi:hypothetical protein
LAESFQDTVALAEILVPGIRVPTFDSVARPAQTAKKICHFRKQALDLAMAQPATRGILDDLLAGKTLDTKNMTCDAARALFRGAASAKRVANNNGSRQTVDFDSAKKKASVSSLADLNRMNAEAYSLNK